jgi:hypothetical protein
MKVALALHRIGLRGSLMHSLGMGSILAAISLWGRSAAVSGAGRPGSSSFRPRRRFSSPGIPQQQVSLLSSPS